MTSGLLNDWTLRLPSRDRFTRAPAFTTSDTLVKKFNGDVLILPTPFFWFDPAWYQVEVDRCAIVAAAMATAGVLVSALHRDLSQTDDGDELICSPRMIPHRCDHAGLIHRDFKAASVIDLRMVATRDLHGRFAYPINQLRRWANEEDVPADVSIDAMTFPPDWNSLDDMSHKVAQLRKLSSAAVFVSFDAAFIPTMLNAAMNAQVDGIIVHVETDPLSTIARCRNAIDAVDGASMTLWIATKQAMTPQDYVKCFAMGADGMSIDAICDSYLHGNENFALTTAERAARSFGFQGAADSSQRVFDQATQLVKRFVTDVTGYAHSCGVERLSDLCVSHLSPAKVG